MDVAGDSATTAFGVGVANARAAARQRVDSEITANRERPMEPRRRQDFPASRILKISFMTPFKICKFSASLLYGGYCRSHNLKRPKNRLFSATPPTTERLA
jgi:hypothetical protein